MMDTILDSYSTDFCVIDASNLFVCSTVGDEVLLYRAGASALATLILQCADLGIAMDPERAVQTYSGGEQAMLCCLLISLLLPPKPVRVLLVRIIETLSAANERRMVRVFRANAPLAQLFTLADTGPVLYA